jgi:predicted short-subunit dehydrogenase-like oxidoreductase (DUF2520 family)
MAKRPRIGFIGAGRTGTALAVALAEAGYEVVAVASRSPASAQALARRLSGARAVESAQEVVNAADLVFLTVPDDQIRDVSAKLRWRAGVAAVHTSGVETREALSVAASQGAETASLHPLQTLADLEHGAEKLRGSVVAVEADGALRERLLALVEALGATPVELRAEDKALYHASAVLVSNYVVTLAKLATDLWLRFGWERPAALQALLPLLRGTVANLETVGLPAALTGPVTRGDVATVRRHIEALSEAAPDLLATYRALGLQTIAVALAKGGLNAAPAEQLRRLLADESAPVLKEMRTNE